MSTEQLILLAINNIITNIKDVPNVPNEPIFKAIEEFFGQYEDEEGNPLWDTPAALIEMQDIDWSDDRPNAVQTGFFTFNIHIVDSTGYENMKRRLDTNHHSHTAKIAAAFRNRVVSLNELIPQSTGILMNRIQRIKTTFVNELSENIVTIHTFTSTIVDYSALQSYQEKMLNFQLNQHI